MRIKTAIILSAGYGKRVLPITKSIPKPLLVVKNINLLDNTIKFVNEIGIKNIKINTFYLSEQIEKFIKKKNYSININVVKDGNEILDTGGGIYNLIKDSNEEHFLIFNPDTIWNKADIGAINNMETFYFKKKIRSLLMVVKKNKSFDQRFKGDFNLRGNRLFKDKKNDFIYTGCQIINKNVFNNINNKIFSISKIWNGLLEKKELYGYESTNDFIHLTDIEIYNKLNN